MRGRWSRESIGYSRRGSFVTVAASIVVSLAVSIVLAISGLVIFGIVSGELEVSEVIKLLNSNYIIIEERR